AVLYPPSPLSPSSSALLLTRHAPSSPLFPYTTLFRSALADLAALHAPPQRIRVGIDRTEPGEGAVRETERALRVSMPLEGGEGEDRKSTRLNSSHVKISYAVFCLKKKTKKKVTTTTLT